MSQIIVIGGGSAGFFGAIAAATTYPQTQVTLLEATSKPLNKVRISGGGRCNVTHHCFDPGELVKSYPRGGKELRGAFTRFQPQDAIAWFSRHGVSLKTEADGRMFPVTDNSETIVNCLLDTARQAGVTLRTKASVQTIKYLNPGFAVELKTGEILTGARLLIATGSSPAGYKWAKNLGHSLKTPVPSLFTFNLSDPRLQDLAGVSVENVTLCLPLSGGKNLTQTGPLLITHWGISGPGVLKLSAWGARILHENNYQMPLIINWVPEYNQESLRQYLLQQKSALGKKSIYAYSPLPIPRRLWQSLLSFIKINPETPWAELSKKTLNQLVEELTRAHYQINGKGVFKEEFVTCGGVSLTEIDFKTMESKICQGLYFAGEILDIDGITGGFNFQSAWTTGWLAGKAMGVGE